MLVFSATCPAVQFIFIDIYIFIHQPVSCSQYSCLLSTSCQGWGLTSLGLNIIVKQSMQYTLCLLPVAWHLWCWGCGSSCSRWRGPSWASPSPCPGSGAPARYPPEHMGQRSASIWTKSGLYLTVYFFVLLAPPLLCLAHLLEVQCWPLCLLVRGVRSRAGNDPSRSLKLYNHGEGTSRLVSIMS